MEEVVSEKEQWKKSRPRRVHRLDHPFEVQARVLNTQRRPRVGGALRSDDPVLPGQVEVEGASEPSLKRRLARRRCSFGVVAPRRRLLERTPVLP